MYIQDRKVNEDAVRYQAGFPGKAGTLPLDHKEDSVRRVMHTGYVEGQEMHHVVGLDQLGPLLQGRSEQDRRLIVNALNSHGIRTGHDMYNLVSMDDELEHGYREHRPSNAHTQLSDMGLEDRIFEGDELKRNAAFKQSLTQLPTTVIIQQVVPEFAAMIGRPSIEVARSINPNVTTVEQNKKIYAQEVELERQAELQAYKDETAAQLKADLESRNTAKKGGFTHDRLDDLLQMTRGVGAVRRIN